MREAEIYRFLPNLCDLHSKVHRLACRFQNLWKIHRLAYGFFFFMNSTSGRRSGSGNMMRIRPDPNQLPRLIEQAPQWLSGPSPLLPAAGPLADYQTGSKLCSTRCNFYSTIGMG